MLQENPLTEFCGIARVDMDKLMCFAPEVNQVRRHYNRGNEVLMGQFAGSMMRLLDVHGAAEFCTQWPLHDWLPPVEQRWFQVQLVIVDVPEKLLRARMTERGWTESAIQRRLTRWLQAATSAATNHKNTLTPAEHNNTQVITEFPRTN